MCAAHAPIRVLSPGVAERIAAGEVIERPSSVVKELVENSLDAGATEIAVILEDGGKSLIEIIDNGHGMTPENLALCVQHHATSKLSSLEDLDRIMTLGFRGEALPSIAAVSELTLLSRPFGGDTAFELKASTPGEAGSTSQPQRVTFGHFLNSPHGTRIQGRGLFSQIPARLKFLKSQGAEVAQVREWIERLAIAHPKVGFRLVSDDRTLLNLRAPQPNQDESVRISQILSDGEDYPVVHTSVNTEVGDIRVFWLQGMSSPQTRKLIQVVNGRALRDRLLQQAMLAPFRQTLLPGRFPSAVLHIQMNPAELDVNVHPTKTEVRFLNPGKVFHEVESAISAMIAKQGAPAFASASSCSSTFQFDSVPLMPRQETESAYSPRLGVQSTPSATLFSNQPVDKNPLKSGRLVGMLFNTYLLFDLGEEAALVDQHAAHERIRYEQLRKRVFQKSLEGDLNFQSQTLLIPEAVRFPLESRTIIESRLSWLNSLGFEVEIFGEDTLLFRSIPIEWGMEMLRTRLKNLIDRVLAADIHSTSELFHDETVFETLASEACHSSVRAGDRLERMEAEKLVDLLFQCEHPWNCPHGRPTVVKVSQDRFEEWFQRRV